MSRVPFEQVLDIFQQKKDELKKKLPIVKGGGGGGNNGISPPYETLAPIYK